MYEPWWGQAGIAEVYAFKISYDMKAAKLGLPPIALPEALTAFNYLRWGSLIVADRASHDLCFCAKAYSNGLPRFRLFCAFLGAGELEDPGAASMLQTPHAVSLYLNLLVEVHREIAATRTLRGMQAVKKKASTALEDTQLEPQQLQEAAEASEAEMFAFATPLVLSHIDTLFPATEGAFTRADRREVWSLDTQLLIRATRRWCLSIKGMGVSASDANASVFVALPLSLRANGKGEVDVDDFFWVMMLQWAKIASWNVKRSLPRVAWAQKHNPIVHATQIHDKYSGVITGTMAGSTAGTMSGSNAADVTRTLANGSRYLPAVAEQPTAPVSTLARFPFTEAFLRQLSESIYRPGEGQFMADPANYAAVYLKLIICRHRASASEHPCATASTVLLDVMKNGVLWDVNTGGQDLGKEDLSKSAIAIKGDNAPAHRLFSVRNIHLAVSIELSFFSAKKTYTAYNEIVNATISKVRKTNMCIILRLSS
jgi:hypothetical protein